MLALILPVTLAMVVDMVLGYWPWITLIVSSFAFPISGIVVIRSTMEELQRVIDEVAPKSMEADEPANDHLARVDLASDESDEAELDESESSAAKSASVRAENATGITEL